VDAAVFSEDARDVDQGFELVWRGVVWRDGVSGGFRWLGGGSSDRSRDGADFCAALVYNSRFRDGGDADVKRVYGFQGIDGGADNRVVVRTGIGNGKLLGADADVDAGGCAGGYSEYGGQFGGDRRAVVDRMASATDGKFRRAD